MDEDIQMPPGAGARFVQQACPVRFQAFGSGCQIGNFDRHVMQTFAALFDELRDHRIGLRRLQQFNAWTTGGQHRDVYFFLRHCFTQADRKAELLLIERERGVQRSNGDAQMVNFYIV